MLVAARVADASMVSCGVLVADSRRSDRERVEATRAQVLDERLHVAREVHDIVAHSLGVIAVQAGSAPT